MEEKLPGWATSVLAGILLSGAIAGMMSTVDSQLLVASSAMSEDICCECMAKGKVNERKALQISRATTVLWISLGLSALLTERFVSFVFPFIAAILASLAFPKKD